MVHRARCGGPVALACSKSGMCSKSGKRGKRSMQQHSNAANAATQETHRNQQTRSTYRADKLERVGQIVDGSGNVVVEYLWAERRQDVAQRLIGELLYRVHRVHDVKYRR